MNQDLLQDKDLLNKTVGAVFLGCIFASLLYGVTNLQVYIYYRDYPKDARYQKIVVGSLWALDTLNLALSVISIYHYVVIHFGDMLDLLVIFWPLKFQISLSCIIAMYVQVLYALRVWKLGMGTSSRIIPIFVAFLVMVGWGFAIMLIVKTQVHFVRSSCLLIKINSFQSSTFKDMSMPGAAYVVFLPFTVLTAIDVAIAGSMWWYLSRSRSSFERTNNIIINIMRMSLVCGFLTSATSVALLIVYGTVQINLIFLALDFVLTKLYVLSYVSMLTARQSRNYGGTSSSFGDSAPMANVININTMVTTDVYPPNSPVEKESIQLSPVSETQTIPYPPPPPHHVGHWRPYVGGTRGDRDLSYFV